MFDNLFNGLFDASVTNVISITDFLLCLFIALVLGLLIALAYMHKSRYTKSFVLTLALLPAVVCIIIMMVNGNVGTGVAVAGAFSLVRFRSVAGSAKEICIIFLGMTTGLICGMGYLAYSALFTIIMCLSFMIYNHLDLGINKHINTYKTFNIVISEDLDYSSVFDEVFIKYTNSYDLVKVKTTNMGSMFKLTYDVILKDIKQEKALIDELRCRNGNLEISVSRQESIINEL